MRTCCTTLLVALLLINLAGDSQRTVIAQDTPNADVVWLAQGWTGQQREWFYREAYQGSHLVPYEWFVNLEQAGNGKLLADPKHLDELRFIVDAESVSNGAALPVGFVKDPKEIENGITWLGLTCSACHTSQITYNNSAYRIDGGPGQADIQTFLEELTSSLRATLDSEQKFERFFRRLVSGGGDKDRAALRDRLKATVAVREKFDRINSTKAPQRYGFARIDAFGIILNQVHQAIQADQQDQFPADAPVSYPFLWDTPQHDVVQWNGVAPNRPLQTHYIGPLARNVGEVLGVFGEVNVTRDADLLAGYSSTVQRQNLLLIEELLRSLESPRWPEHFPKVSNDVSHGKQLYQKFCINCHAEIDRDQVGRTVKAVLTPVKELETDPQMVNNFLKRRPTGILEGRKKMLLFGERFESEAPGGEILTHVIAGTIIHRPIDRFGPAELLRFVKVLGAQGLLAHVRDRFENIKGELTSDDQTVLRALEKMYQQQDEEPAYKARPLNGIWATAPYLHNGSVPNLAQLLLPANQRLDHFYVGSREFDPENVGFKCSKDDGKFEFRTKDGAGRPIAGNSNAGHSGAKYGAEISADERKDLLEYLKTL